MLDFFASDTCQTLEICDAPETVFFKVDRVACKEVAGPVYFICHKTFLCESSDEEFAQEGIVFVFRIGFKIFCLIFGNIEIFNFLSCKCNYIRPMPA